MGFLLVRCPQFKPVVNLNPPNPKGVAHGSGLLNLPRFHPPPAEQSFHVDDRLHAPPAPSPPAR